GALRDLDRVAGAGVENFTLGGRVTRAGDVLVELVIHRRSEAAVTVRLVPAGELLHLHEVASSPPAPHDRGLGVRVDVAIRAEVLDPERRGITPAGGDDLHRIAASDRRYFAVDRQDAEVGVIQGQGL